MRLQKVEPAIVFEIVGLSVLNLETIDQDGVLSWQNAEILRLSAACCFTQVCGDRRCPALVPKFAMFRALFSTPGVLTFSTPSRTLNT